MRIPAHRASTAHLQALYPFVADGGLGGRGVYVGREVLGGSFCYDPWTLYADGVLTNPNMLVAGQVGRGKSAFVKTYLWRQLVFGRQAWIVDPKGEYTPLAHAVGAAPIRLGPGQPARLNPLDIPSGGHPEQALRQRAALLTTLAAASLHRTLTPVEGAAVELALRDAAARHHQPLVPHVAHALLHPHADAARQLAVDADTLAADSHDVALELRRLCHGDLAGLFDAPTTPGLDLDAPVVVLDLSALYGSDALGLLMVCATAWLQARLAAATRRRIIVIDEAWAVLANLQIARWLRSCWKLARRDGIAGIAVIHRLSDLTAAGADGSEQQRLAHGLLADSETRVVYAQAPGEADTARRLLGLSDTETELLPQLGRGIALWHVAHHRFLVHHRLAAAEAAIVDTDQRMTH